jgi:dihydrofolate reductase
MKRNKVFIATSLDGYIADKDGGIDWLHEIPNPNNIDMGYTSFMSEVDAIIMGRTTFETVFGFDMEWPYLKPVFVLSNTLTSIPSELSGKVTIVNGALKDILSQIHEKGHHKLYIDGGRTIQSFLEEDLIDEMTITVIPTLLGAGSPLFSNLSGRLEFDCTETTIFLEKVVQNHFKRNKLLQ